jgi:photosystem II stability/assembly factor-like uncharacterized protein
MRKGQLLLKTLFVLYGWSLFSCRNAQTGAEQIEPGPGLRQGIDISIETPESETTASIRGLFMVNDTVGWASGSGGTFLRMVDGANWISDTIAGYTHLDFRDVHGFDENTAVLIASGNEGRILRTKDGGENWTEVYTRLDSGIFLDGMDFNKFVGYAYGDPIHGKFVLLRTEDQGRTWSESSELEQLPVALANEAGFAASGTGIVLAGAKRIIATGGDSVARIMHTDNYGNWSVSNTPLRSESGCGIFSIAVINEKIVAVGGCYLDSTSTDRNCAVSEDWGRTWKLISENPPQGYRSCVAASNDQELLVTCGRTGVEYSVDEGENWIPLTDEGFYTCSLADSTGWLMGRGGKMAKISWKLTE